jgi:6-phosphogluconolactonase
MELVVSPVDLLRPKLTEMFEEWASGSERRTCALSGGATALIFLGALRSAAVDWSRITLFWGDERAVPAEDPESNYGVAARLLLQPLGANAPRAFRMPADLPNLDEAALHYDQTLAHELHNGVLDLAILGVGDDGHVCSLFPGHQALTNDELRVVAVEDAPKPPLRRLSLTLPFLAQTKRIWLVMLGSRKLPVLYAAISRTQRLTPLDLLLHQAKDVTVFTDQVIHRT